MAEALATAASIVTVLQLAGTVAAYLNSVANAPEERGKIFEEIGSITGILFMVKDLADRGRKGGSSPSFISALIVAKGPLEQFKAALDTLASRLSPGGVWTEVGRALFWPFTKKEILEILQSMERLKTHFMLAFQGDIFDLLKATNAGIGKVAETVDQLKLGKDDEELQRILDWLSTSDMDQKQQYNFSLYQEGTCYSFLESEKFTNWLEKDETAPILWCPGDPGAGKTVVTSIAIDHTRKSFQNEDIGIAFVYCHYNDTEANATIPIIATLARQLALRNNSIHLELKKLYKKLTKDKKLTRPTVEELQSLVSSLASSFKKTFILVDAIDECEKEERATLLSTLNDLGSLENSHIRIFATSRPYAQDILLAFQSSSRLDIRATESDIKKFIKSEIESDAEFLELIEVKEDSELDLVQVGMERPKLKDTIISSVASQASEMFLIAALQIKRIRASDSLKEVKDALRSMPTDLTKMYDDSLERMKKQTEIRYKRGLRVLAWISRSKRLLSVEELLHALVAEEGDETKPPRRLDKDSLVKPKVLVDVCAGLVTIEPKSRTVRLIHTTAQEYLDQRDDGQFSFANDHISKACLIYLSFDEFARGPCVSDKEMEQRLKDFPFLKYSARFWGQHLQKAEDKHLQEIAVTLLGKDTSIMSINQVSHLPMFRFANYSQLYPKAVQPLHIAASFGLYEMTRLLAMRNNIDLNSTDCFGWTALHRAAENGYVDIVKFFLGKKCDTNILAQYGGAPLHRAAKNGHEEVAKLLLDGGAQVDADDNYGGTPLHRAARSGHEAVVKLLLARSVDVNRNYNFEVTLRLMLENGTITSQVISDSFQIFALWEARDEAALRIEAEITARDRLRGGTALHEAAGAGSVSIAQLLLEEGRAEIDAMDNFGGTPLQRAASKGHQAVIDILLQRGAFVNSISHYGVLARELIEMTSKTHNRTYVQNPSEFQFEMMLGGSSLHEAAKNGHDGAVRLLLAKGANPNVAGTYGSSALHEAARNGHGKIVQALLDKGADVDLSKQISMDRTEGTALHEAAEYGHEDIVHVLLKAGANINRTRGTENTEATPLSLAAKRGHQALCKLLLNWGAEVSWKNETTRQTALSIAAENGDTAIVELLLSQGAEQVEGEEKAGGMQQLLNRENNYNGRQFTPLSLAAEKGHKEVARLLLQNGADPNWRSHGGVRVLHIAIRSGSVEIVKELLAMGADPNAPGDNPILSSAIDMIASVVEERGLAQDNGQDGSVTAEVVQTITEIYAEIVQSLLENGADVSRKSRLEKTTPLEIAALEGYDRIAALLIANKADVNETDTTPLYNASMRGHLSMVQLLLDAGARADLGLSSLLVAASEGHDQVAKLLLAHGVDVKGADSSGETPLYNAATSGHVSMIQLFLTAGARVNVGLSPLYGAAKGGSEAAAQLLLDNDAQISQDSGHRPEALANAADNGVECIVRALVEGGESIEAVQDGETLLHKAAKKGHHVIVKFLLDKGAQIDAKEVETERTPLLLAVKEGHETTAQILLENGASPDPRDKTTGHTPLSWASAQGMKILVPSLLERDVELNSLIASGNTPLALAAEKGHNATVQLLLEKGAEPDTNKHKDGMTPLCFAAFQGHATTLRLLADFRADINGKGVKKGSSPLQLAAQQRHVAVIRELLRRNAEIDIGDIDGGTSSSLTWAVCNEDYEIALLLLEAGALADKSSLPVALSVAIAQNDLKMTRLLIDKVAEVSGEARPLSSIPKLEKNSIGHPFVLAAEKGNEAIVQTLLDAGAHNDAEMALHISLKHGRLMAARHLLSKLQRVDSKIIGERTLLGLAAERGYEDIVRSLLELGVDPNAEDSNSNRTALSYAAEKGHVRVVMLLLDKGQKDPVHNSEILTAGIEYERISKLLVDLVSDWSQKSDSGSILARVCGLGYERVVKLLLDRDVDPNVDWEGRTPIQLASLGGNLPVVQLLLERNVDLDARDTKYGQSALSFASEMSFNSIVRALLEKNADVESRDSQDESTPLLWAAKKGNEVAARLLLEKGAQVNVGNSSGLTSLMAAAENGNGAVVKVLLEHGANVQASDSKGKTALHYASAGGFQTTTRILLEHPDIDIKVKDSVGETSLSLAKSNGHGGVVKLLEARANELTSGAEQMEEPGVEEPGLKEPGAEEPRLKELGVEEPGLKEPGVEEPGLKEPGVEEPGAEHPSIPETASNLGNLYKSQGKLDEAEKMYIQALHGYEEAFGPKHTSSLDTVNNLAILYMDQGKLDEAKTMYMRVMQGYEETLGPKDSSTLDTINNLGNLYKTQGKPDEAEEMYTRAIQGYGEIFTPQALATYRPALGTLWSLGSLYSAKGDITKAKSMYARSLDGFRALLGPSCDECQRLEQALASLDSSEEDIVVPRTKNPEPAQPNKVHKERKSFFGRLKDKFPRSNQ